MTGYLYSDLCDFIFNSMNHIIEFQKHIYFNNAVMKSVSFSSF